jgi:hypothetical protein
MLMGLTSLVQISVVKLIAVTAISSSSWMLCNYGSAAWKIAEVFTGARPVGKSQHHPRQRTVDCQGQWIPLFWHSSLSCLAELFLLFQMTALLVDCSIHTADIVS